MKNKIKRYEHFVLSERAGAAIHPSFHVVDMRQQRNALSFINRRGYAPTLTCYNCGWVATCKHCDANLTYQLNS